MIVEADAVAPQAWKNGGGVTRELLRWPGSGDWRLRLSLADITADGPFSAFPGVQRWFVVLEGDGVELTIAGQLHRLQPGDAPLHFDGGATTSCRLLGGPTRDLNLMLAGLDGELRPAAAGEAPPYWSFVGFFDAGTRQLHWPFVDEAAPAAGWWIAAAA